MERVRKLPKWAQQHIQNLEYRARKAEDDLSVVSSMHGILADPNRNWFTIPNMDREKVMRLWLLDSDSPFPVCALGPGDVFFVGRSKDAP